MGLLFRFAALVAVFVFIILGYWTAAFIAMGTCVALLIVDGVRRPGLLSGSWLILAGAIGGLCVCWFVGFLLVQSIGPHGTVYIGPGLEAWNWPGTLIGLLIWIGTGVIWMKRYR